MTITVVDDFTVLAVETLTSVDEEVFYIAGSDQNEDPDLTNFGTIRATATANFQGTLAAIVNSSFNHFFGGGIWNRAGATIEANALGSQADAYGFSCGSWSPDIRNDGTWTVRASAHAVGVLTWDPDFLITNNGTFVVEGGSAVGLQLQNSGTFINTGSFTVHSSGSSVSYGVQYTYHNIAFNNSGSLIVTDEVADESVAVSFESNLSIDPPLINSGLIQADIAFKGAHATIRNEGTGIIDGKIVLSGGGNSVINNGEILADVILGDGANVYDGRTGHIDGTVYGGIGDDTILGGAENNKFYGTPGASSGQDGDHTLFGYGGDDSLFGGRGNDTIDGGDGNDLLSPDYGENTVNGGIGKDTVSYESSLVGVRVNLGLTGAQDTRWGLDTLVSTENVIGSDFKDVLTGDSGANRLMGGRNRDTLRGGDGSDVLFGGDGPDRLVGGRGADTLRGEAGKDAYVYTSGSESSGKAHDLISGPNFDDDSFDLRVVVDAVVQRSGVLNTASFDSDLAAAVDFTGGGPREAVLFDPTSGDLDRPGHVYLVIDLDNDGAYVAGNDLVIELVNPTGTLTPSDFI